MKDFEDIIHSISEEVKEIACKLHDCELSLTEAEQLLRETTRDWERRLLQVCYVHRATKAISEVTCPNCGESMFRQRLRRKWILTMCGEVLVSRWYYQCKKGHYYLPWDAQQQLRGRYSKKVAEVMCRLSARLDFREAVDELKRQGIFVSHTTLEQTVESWGTAVNVPLWVEQQPLDKQQRWYLTCDGCHTNSKDGWHETKVGCVYRDYPQHGENAEAHAIEDSVRYVATRDSAQAFGGQWFSMAVKCGVYRQGEENASLIAIGDGAEWIWNLVEEYFPTAVQIIDYHHATAHLWECARKAFGEQNQKRVQRWVKNTEYDLFAVNIKKVATRIRKLAQLNPTVATELHTQALYFEKHAQRMQYHRFRKKGYHIGSGIVESACKHVVAERCKQAGMKWNKKGIDAILNIRCLLKNNNWDLYWQANGKIAKGR